MIKITQVSNAKSQITSLMQRRSSNSQTLPKNPKGDHTCNIWQIISSRTDRRTYRTHLNLYDLQNTVRAFKYQKLEIATTTQEEDEYQPNEVESLPYEDTPFNSGRSLTVSGKQSFNFYQEKPSSSEDYYDNIQDEFQPIIRSQEQKLTYSTAGFGHESQGGLTMKESIHNNQMHVIEEDESGSSYESDAIISPQPRSQGRQQSRKITFNQNYDLISHKSRNSNRPKSLSIKNSYVNQTSIITSRENSYRSMTYTPVPSLISQNISYKSFINNIQGQNNQGAVFRSRSAKSMATNEDLPRNSGRQISSATTKFSKNSAIPSCFAQYSGIDPVYVNDSPFTLEFDRMHQFKIYYPEFNYDRVIRRANTFKSEQCIYSPYTFDSKLRRKLEKASQIFRQNKVIMSFQSPQPQ